MARDTTLVLHQPIENLIHQFRGYRVLLDSDLAKLYGVETRALIQALKRNKGRFPADFVFQLTDQEVRRLRSQSVIILRKKHLKTKPYAFTENGVAMLSSVLRSARAISVNIEIMRAFTRLRKIVSFHNDLSRKIAELEKRYDHKFKVVFDAIFKLMNPPKTRAIGFKVKSPK